MKSNYFHLKHSFITCTIFLMIFSACKKEENKKSENSLASLTTQIVSLITQNSASTGGNISADGGTPVSARGVCWSTTTQPTINNDKTTDGTGTGNFISNISGLSQNTKYYVRAYATTSAGTAYGQQEEFTTNIGASLLTTGLLSYWKADESSGSTVSDELGNWNLNFVGSPVWVSGKINNAIDFGTTSSRYAEKTGISSGNTNTYTLSSWIYLEDTLPNPKLIMGINSGTNVSNAGAAEVKMMITIDNRLATLYHTSDGALTVMQRIGGTVIAINTWYHVVAVINNGDISLYINGIADTVNAVTNPTASNLNFTNGRVTIGHARLWQGNYNPDRWFRGRIDEAAIWTRPLSGGEIQQLYNGGDGLQYPF